MLQDRFMFTIRYSSCH